MRDEQDPLFDDLPRPKPGVETPYTPVTPCANCGRLRSEDQMIWEDDRPFCSLECLAEFEHNQQESLFND